MLPPRFVVVVVVFLSGVMDVPDGARWSDNGRLSVPCSHAGKVVSSRSLPIVLVDIDLPFPILLSSLYSKRKWGLREAELVETLNEMIRKEIAPTHEHIMMLIQHARQVSLSISAEMVAGCRRCQRRHS